MTRTILTCSPLFIDLALNELRRSQAEAVVLQHLAPGHILLETPRSFDQLTCPWQHHLPIYLHHLFPVHSTVPLTATLADLPCLKQAAARLLSPDTLVQVRVVAETDLPYFSADLQQAITEKPSVYTTAPPIGRILSILVTQTTAYLGISDASQNLSPWAGGQTPFAEPVSNRAGYKLLEALATFSIRLRHGDQALDLGAAPGAWTTLLRRRGLRVTAVAPTELYSWLRLDPDVTYHPLLAQEYLGRCQTTFDLIVNDMKMDAQDSARLMVDYAPHLRSGGIALMTMKLREENKLRIMDHTLRLLRKAYKIIRVRQLVANRKEVTLFLRRKT